MCVFQECQLVLKLFELFFEALAKLPTLEASLAPLLPDLVNGTLRLLGGASAAVMRPAIPNQPLLLTPAPASSGESIALSHRKGSTKSAIYTAA